MQKTYCKISVVICCNLIVQVIFAELQGTPVLLVAHRVTLVVAFPFLLQNFGKAAGTYELYFLNLWVQVEEIGGGDTQTPIA